MNIKINLFDRLKNIGLFVFSCLILVNVSCSGQSSSKNIKVIKASSNTRNMKLNQLTDSEKDVILGKGTERAFTGEYTDHFEKGTYVCR
jgi:peptide-methionine (R)-S-oxide reductase